MTTPAVRLLWAAIVLGLLGAALPASLAHAEGSDRRRALFAAFDERDGTGTRAELQHVETDTDCHDDASGDSTDPRADIVEWCAYVGDDQILVSMRLANSTVPQQDSNWEGATGAMWGFDTDGDEQGDYLAALYRLDGQVHFEIGDESGNTVCAATQMTTSSQIYEGRFAAHCLGQSAQVGVGTLMIYDSSPGSGELDDIHVDGAPDGGMTTVTRHTHGTTTPTPSPTPTQTSTGSRVTSRLAGPTRVHTAIAVSQRAFPSGAGVVYLSSQNMTPDALVAGALTDGPILLVPSCGPLPQEVVAEIRRLGPREVVALGGVNAVCDATLAAAAAV